MIFSSISLNFTSFEVSLDLAMVLHLIGGLLMKINSGAVTTYGRDEFTIELGSN